MHQMNLDINTNPILILVDNEGIGYFQVTQKNGFRCSTAVGYLNPIKNRKNLKIITKAHIKNIEFVNKKAVRVNYWLGKLN